MHLAKEEIPPDDGVRFLVNVSIETTKSSKKKSK
jgi:hypothetical protein